MPTKTLEQRFWEKVEKTPNCWLWVGAVDGGGYGKIYQEPRIRRASQISWELHYGLIPPGQCVLHHCDNPPCVNPLHLFLGSLSDNTQDMLQKGRHKLNPPKGERNRHAKLSQEQVIVIRQIYTFGFTQSELAITYSVTQATISSIILYKTWKHI